MCMCKGKDGVVFKRALNKRMKWMMHFRFIFSFYTLHSVTTVLRTDTILFASIYNVYCINWI